MGERLRPDPILAFPTSLEKGAGEMGPNHPSGRKTKGKKKKKTTLQSSCVGVSL